MKEISERVLGPGQHNNGSSPEVRGYSRGLFVEFLIEPGVTHLNGSVPGKTHQGMSLHERPFGRSDLELALAAPPEVYGFRRYAQASALITRDGVQRRFTANEREYEPGIVYIDGEVIDLDEAISRAGRYGPDLEERIKKDGWSGQIVQTRNSVSWKTKFKLFGENDSVVSTKPSTNGSE